MSMSLALDLMLKAIISTSDFQSVDKKPWDAISRLVPGTTADQCEQRYNELVMSISSNLGSMGTTDLPARRPSSITESSKDLARPGSSRVKANKLSKTNGGAKDSKYSMKDVLLVSSTGTGVPASEQSPIMVIHVCDEAKNLKQDFTCPRDLLVQEMRYFAEYLSTDTQRMEEVDISVHCDVQIFDWLMKFVKRTTRESNGSPPTLEPGNVVSILISSDFLKMDSLVDECIKYCHANMSAVIATPCNMNCIDDRLVARMADCFNHSELDAIKDRKDKFKSKLFAKKVEKLFDASTSDPGSPENASTLFKCSCCKKILTKNLEKRVKCLQSRMTINRYGKFSYSHSRDLSWDASDWLLEVRNQLKAWCDVYWYVWGTINYLDCARCDETFSCVELANCRYHPEQPFFDPSKPMGEYSCCGLKVLRFDPLQQNQGCRLRDHIIKVLPSETDDKVEKSNSRNQVYDDLLAHRDIVCLPHLRTATSLNDDADVNVFAADEIVTGLLQQTTNVAGGNRMTMSDFRSDIRFGPRLKPLVAERETTYDDRFDGGDSDDEVGDDEEAKIKSKQPGPRNSKVTLDPHGILLDAPGFGTSKTNKWDANRSLRYNQDAQREEDQRRMREIVAYLTRLRMPTEKMEKLKQREFAGGIFSRLEVQWKAANMPLPKPSNAAFRSKPARLGQVLAK